MKKILLTIAGVAASGVILAGCGSGDTQETTTAAAETTTAQNETTSEVATTTVIATEETTTEQAASSEIYTDESKSYNIQINKYATGYIRSGDLEYTNSAGDEYEYDILDDTSTHALESRVDGEAVEVTLIDQGRLEDGNIYYVYGQDDGKYKMVAFKYIGPSGDTNAYAELKVERSETFSPTEALELLNDEYITFTAK